ncbi:aldose 1-epimerase [Lactobacillus colini]|uniref:Aldose 1-epimerase n=1 Tax=Lactobacillus colini TaxID=1819254 RepID=A0ABS4MBW7_9LACO|nr:aldose epimerase family protein [Lactobacillus colini]MBP2057155.1 aldose 1-epimerase [Lactobacillus colini]
MKTSFIKYGQKDGKDLCEITLKNNKGMEVKVLNYGATLEKVIFKGENMILSLPHPSDYSKERNFLGGTVGRICGRIKSGQWKHGDATVQLPKNDGENHIHGGIGTDMRVWDFRLDKRKDTAKVVLTLLDPDGNNGFPGNMKLTASYELDNDNSLLYKLEAVSDQMTIFNPANHTYFTLGEKSARDVWMNISADYFLPVSRDGLPIAGMESLKGTAFDFTQGKRISEALDSNDDQIKLRNGLDHPFILGCNRPAATLTTRKYQMTMSTNAPAIVVYTGNHFNNTGVASNIGQYDGVTLEAQCPPTSGSDLSEITLLPNEKFNRWAWWYFE